MQLLKFLCDMQLLKLLCVILGSSWGFSIFMALKKIDCAWIGLLVGLIVGIGFVGILLIIGKWVIVKLNLYGFETLSLSFLYRLLLSWLIAMAMLLVSFIAPWGVDWIIGSFR